MRFVLLLLLTGCQAPQPRIITIKEPIEVRIPVAVACAVAMPARPGLMTDDQILDLSNYGAVLALRLNVLLLTVYAAELEILLAACIQPKAAS